MRLWGVGLISILVFSGCFPCSGNNHNKKSLELFCKIEGDKVAVYFLAVGEGYSLISDIKVTTIKASGASKLSVDATSKLSADATRTGLTYVQNSGRSQENPRLNTFTLVEHKPKAFIQKAFEPKINQTVYQTVKTESDPVSIIKGPVYDNLNVELIETLELGVKFILIDLDERHLRSDGFGVREEDLTFKFVRTIDKSLEK